MHEIWLQQLIRNSNGINGTSSVFLDNHICAVDILSLRCNIATHKFCSYVQIINLLKSFERTDIWSTAGYNVLKTSNRIIGNMMSIKNPYKFFIWSLLDKVLEVVVSKQRPRTWVPIVKSLQACGCLFLSSPFFYCRDGQKLFYFASSYNNSYTFSTPPTIVDSSLPYQCKPSGFGVEKDDLSDWVANFDSFTANSDKEIFTTFVHNA